MHRYRNKLLAVLALFAFLILASCSTPPRTTTQAERDAANFSLTQAEVAVTVMLSAGKVSPESAQLARKQIEALRGDIAASETTPVSWLELFSRVEALALQWVLPPAPAAEPVSTPPPAAAPQAAPATPGGG